MASKTPALPLGKTATFYLEGAGLKTTGSVVAKARKIAAEAGDRQVKIEHVLSARGLDPAEGKHIRGQRVYQSRKAKASA